MIFLAIKLFSTVNIPCGNSKVKCCCRPQLSHEIKMSEQDEVMKAKKDFLERKMNDRQREVAENQKHSKSEANVEELVSQFYSDLQPALAEVEALMAEAEGLSEATVGPQLDRIVVALNRITHMVTDAGIFLPPYDSKKCQTTLTDLNSKFQELQERVKPKKKFGFKSRKQKVVTKLPEVSKLSLAEDCVDTVSKAGTSGYSLKEMTGQTVVVRGEEARGQDLSLSHLERCRVEILGSPQTLHLSNITNCTILSGPVSTSVMVDGCQDSRLAISCQQLRTHSTTNSDIYLHTTARAIIEDCRGVRVAPYNWTYPGMEEDYLTAGLDTNINHWDQLGDFNWLSTDRPSPNWSVLPASDRVTSWDQ